MTDPRPSLRVSRAAERALRFAATRFFLNLRLASRVTVGMSAATTGRPWLAVAAFACVLYDVLYYLALRRGLRIPLPVRLALDAADVSVWSMLYGAPLDAPSLVAAPLAFETALLRGATGLLAPLVVCVAASTVLLATGGQLSPAPLLWPGFGAVGGLLFSRYLEARLRQRLRTAEAERQAARSQAELAGRHSVAVGADTVVDLLTRTWPLLAVPGKPAASPLSAWRQRLSEETADHAEYLAVALLRWEQRHNLASPDLSRDVEFRPTGGCSSLLLTPHQVSVLEELLVRLAPTGTVTVTVPRPRPLGLRQDLHLGDRAVSLPADERPHTPPFDPGPAMIGLGALGSLGHAYPDMDGVPLPPALGLTASGLAVAWWAHRRVMARGTSAHGVVLAAALGFGAVDALVSTAFMQTLESGGLTRLPYLHFLLFAGPLAVMYLRDLSAARRWGTLAATGAILAACTALLPVPLHLADVTALSWPLAFTAGTSSLRDLLDEENSGFDEELARARAAAVSEGYRGGRADVLLLVREAAEEARRRLTQDRTALDPVFLPEIERRLTEVDHRLATLQQVTPGRPA
ncbi:hypothetical protein ACIBHX_43200 [Nonomuraea sp. NPDC050536]|uniref:hypothetical protein n=1 Tax=Nonomuraea sp. NPDC050536 TaxID=3364366 RepID=UPI0037C4FE52